MEVEVSKIVTSSPFPKSLHFHVGSILPGAAQNRRDLCLRHAVKSLRLVRQFQGQEARSEKEDPKAIRKPLSPRDRLGSDVHKVVRIVRSKLPLGPTLVVHLFPCGENDQRIQMCQNPHLTGCCWKNRAEKGSCDSDADFCPGLAARTRFGLQRTRLFFSGPRTEKC